MQRLTIVSLFVILIGTVMLGMLPTALADPPADGGSLDVVERSFSRSSGPQPNSLPLSGQAQGRDYWPDEFVVDLDGLHPDAIPLTLVRIPDGWFRMGSPTTERGHVQSESPWHERLLAPPFYMSKYETTQAQWDHVLGYLPQGLFGDDIGLNYPVYAVSHHEIGFFLRKLVSDTQEDLNRAMFGQRKLMSLYMP